MASYSYYNGVCYVTTQIRYGFKRFHSMNAQFKVETCLGAEMCVNGVRAFKRYSFISYATPILYAVYDNKYDHWLIDINANALHYSSTTRRQLSKFMREYNIPLSLNDIRIAEKSDSILSFAPSDNVDCWFVSTDTLNDRMR